MLCLRCRWPYVGGGESDPQDGLTALMCAAQWGRANCVRLLIDAGADKDTRNNVRRRSLHRRSSIIFYFFASLSCDLSS
jgi:ankyrin repeat protein